MSDKDDKRLEDLGWKKMEDLLDKKLPQKRKRRPFFIFWLSAAGVACLIGMTFLYTLYQNEGYPHNNPASLEKKEIAEQKAQLNNSSNTPTTIIDKPINTASNEIKKPVPNVEKRVLKSNIPRLIKAILNTDPPRQKSATNIPLKNEVNNLILIEKAPSELASRTIFNTNALAFIKPKLIENSTPIIAHRTDVFKAHRSKRMVYGLQVGGNLVVPSYDLGASAGFFVELPIRQSNWSLESGLYFRHYGKQKPFSIATTLIRDDKIRSFQMLGYPAGFTDFVVNNQNELILNNGKGNIEFNESQSFIGIPFVLHFKASRRLALKAGFHYERQIPHWIQEPTYFANQTENNTAFDSSVLVNFQTSFPVQMSKNKLYLNAGILFQLTNRIDLETEFNYQLNNSIQNLPITINDHSIKLGIRYRMGTISF